MTTKIRNAVGKRSLTRIAVLISGQGSNMAAILRNVEQGVLQGICEVALVLSNRPEAPGLDAARRAGVETLLLPSSGKRRSAYGRELVEALAPYHLDYLVLAGFMYILPPMVLQSYPRRVINIHPADTSRHRGLHAYEWAFKNGLDETCITVHWVDQGVDTGEVMARAPVDLRGATSLAEVERRGLAIEHRFYSEVLRDFFNRTEVPAVPDWAR